MKLAAVLLVAMTSHAFAEDKVAADAAFRAAKELEKAGKLAEACPLYETSYRNDPQLGALLNVANCHELTGRTATAWVEYRDALELAVRRGDHRVDYTRKRLDTLEPKLMRLRIEAPVGVSVERNGTDVTALVRQDLAVDPGSYKVRATAAGKVAFETAVTVSREGETVRVDVPILADVVVETKPTPAPPVVVTAPVKPVQVEPAAPAPSHRKTIALVIGSVGLAAAGVGAGFGLHARSQWNASRDSTSCDAHNVCNDTGRAQIAAAKSSATTATWALGASAAMLVTAGVVYFTAPAKTERRVAIVPAVDRESASVTAFARF